MGTAGGGVDCRPGPRRNGRGPWLPGSLMADRNTVFVLDFDGVLCDSCDELAASAWRAGRPLWPDRWRETEPPAVAVDRFRHLRPLMDTGWQAILLLHLIVDNPHSDADIAAGFPALLEQELVRLAALAEAGRLPSTAIPQGVGAKALLVELFAGARDQWIRDDLPGWLARHRFYAPAVAFLPRLQQRGEVRILTTKQKRFTERLLAAAGLAIPGDRVFGLESGPKADMLAAFRAEAPARALAFVEDRYEALLKVRQRPELAAVRLFFATWGYALPQDQAAATRNPAVTVLTLATLERLLA